MQMRAHAISKGVFMACNICMLQDFFLFMCYFLSFFTLKRRYLMKIVTLLLFKIKKRKLKKGIFIFTLKNMSKGVYIYAKNSFKYK